MDPRLRGDDTVIVASVRDRRARRGPHAARGRTSRSIFGPLSWRALVRSCMDCKFIQNSGLVPKKRASRNAVSAVTERSPLTIAPMRVAGTRKAIASAFTDMPSGARNSSPSASPGCVVTRLGVATPLVVVDDFDIGRPLLFMFGHRSCLVDAAALVPFNGCRPRESGDPSCHKP